MKFREKRKDDFFKLLKLKDELLKLEDELFSLEAKVNDLNNANPENRKSCEC